MKINTLLEYTSPSSQPNQAGGQAPKFGRDPNVLETTAGSTATGSIGADAKAMPGLQTRGGKGSMFQGISTSKKFVNSPVTEDEISEEQLLTKELRKELFKRAKDRDLGNRPEDREIMSNDPEYDDEAGMVASNLHTALRAVQGLHKVIGPNENLPEWVQEKIAIANDYLVTCWDYMISQHEQGRKYEVDEASSDKYFMPGGGASFGRRNREDDEYHVPDPVDPNTIPYNVKVNGKVINDKPLPGRQAAIHWAKQKVDAGEIDPEVTTLSPIQKMIKPGFTEDSRDKYSKLSNRGVNRGINRAADDFGRMMDLDQAESPHYRTQHQRNTKQRLQTKPMAGPKGALPEGAKVDRMVKHVKQSEIKAGKSAKDAENIAWATANKRGMLESYDPVKSDYGQWEDIIVQDGWNYDFADGARALELVAGDYRGPDGYISTIRNILTYVKQNRQVLGKAVADRKTVKDCIIDIKNRYPQLYQAAQQPEGVAEGFDKNAYDPEDYFVVRKQSPRDIENNTPSKFWDQVSRHDSLGDAQQTIEKLRQQNPNAKFTYTMHRRSQGVAEGMGGQVVFSGTGDNGGKYEIIQSGDDFMIHANGKHIDSYGSLQRAMSVLKNEVPGLKKTVDEESKGLWANIHAKRERIKHGSGERMRKPGSKGAPTADALRKSAK